MKETLKPPYRYMLQKLKEARAKARLTQSDVGEALGETQTWVSKVERGERRIDPVELSRFASLYRREIDFFLLLPSATEEEIEPLEVTLRFEGEVARAIREKAFQDGIDWETIVENIVSKNLMSEQ